MNFIMNPDTQDCAELQQQQLTVLPVLLDPFQCTSEATVDHYAITTLTTGLPIPCSSAGPLPTFLDMNLDVSTSEQLQSTQEQQLLAQQEHIILEQILFSPQQTNSWSTYPIPIMQDRHIYWQQPCIIQQQQHQELHIQLQQDSQLQAFQCNHNLDNALSILTTDCDKSAQHPPLVPQVNVNPIEDLALYALQQELVDIELPLLNGPVSQTAASSALNALPYYTAAIFPELAQSAPMQGSVSLPVTPSQGFQDQGHYFMSNHGQPLVRQFSFDSALSNMNTKTMSPIVESPVSMSSISVTLNRLSISANPPNGRSSEQPKKLASRPLRPTRATRSHAPMAKSNSKQRMAPIQRRSGKVWSGMTGCFAVGDLPAPAPLTPSSMCVSLPSSSTPSQTFEQEESRWNDQENNLAFIHERELTQDRVAEKERQLQRKGPKGAKGCRAKTTRCIECQVDDTNTAGLCDCYHQSLRRKTANAFILFRKVALSKNKGKFRSLKYSGSQISKSVSVAWKGLLPEDKKLFQRRAEYNAAHAMMNVVKKKSKGYVAKHQ